MTSDPLSLKGIHHVELWVGNARQAAYYYQNAFGFSPVAYRGLETGAREVTSHVLAQGEAVLVLTSSLVPRGEVADHTRLHGDGVRDIAFEVDDAEAAFRAAVARGAAPAVEPHRVTEGGASMVHAAVRTYGDTLHSLVSHKHNVKAFAPGYMPADAPAVPGVGLRLVDHIVGNVEEGKMAAWGKWYEDVLGFERYITFDDKDISTEYSALRSIVMSDAQRRVKFPINEPAAGKSRSQIQEYLDWYPGPGAQHIALLTDDIIGTVSEMRRRGVRFLSTPRTYYETLEERVGELDEDVKTLEELEILVDVDENGYLLQIFTMPVQDRPTLFYEVIQRKGARGFGKGNFKALFESIEREQARRGNL